jgi:hypothetical protein
MSGLAVYVCPDCGKSRPETEFRSDRMGLPYGACRRCRGCKTGNAYRDEHGRTCTVCDVYQPYAAFNKREESPDGYAPKCRECVKKRARARYKVNNPDMGKRWSHIHWDDNGRTCTGCHTYKPRGDFSPLRTSPDGCHARCKTCEAAAARDRRRRKKKQDQINRPDKGIRMQWGDNDTYGNPDGLLFAVEKELAVRGIQAEAYPHNSYDVALSLTGHGLARLLHVVRTGTTPTEEETAAIITELVSFDGTPA